MYLMFWLSVSVGSAFIDFFDILFGAVFVDGFGALLSAIGSPEWLIGIRAGGVGAGIQTVATFIPVVFFMFLGLSILEDSGYMARAAFVMDRLMRFLGLPGKAFRTDDRRFRMHCSGHPRHPDAGQQVGTGS
jgi:ferrous iron transport protein B